MQLMPFDPSRVETILVDSYSTLVDMRSMEDMLEEYTSHAKEVAMLWFQRSKIYGVVAAKLDEYRPCREKYRISLMYSLHTAGVSISDRELEEILDGIDSLEVFDDVRDGLRRFSNSGYDVYVLSNGDVNMLENLVTHADIRNVIAGTISAEEIGHFKPDRRLYRHAAVRTDTPISDIAHITASWNDVLGAKNAGIQDIWLNRTNDIWEGFLADPSFEINTLHELADILEA